MCGQVLALCLGLTTPQRGRSALTYVIDRRNGHVTLEFVKLLLQKGVNIAERDDVSDISLTLHVRDGISLL